MPLPLLLVLTATAWIGAARVPRALVLAGFEVTLLAPRGALAEKSGYLARIAYLPDNATTMQWVHAFAATVRATRPRMIVPCDDTAFRLLQMLVLSPPAALQPALHFELAALIVDSLGDPTHYETSVDKTLLPSAAVAMDVPMPPHAIIASIDEARAFAAQHGYPMILKRRHSSAGDGVAIVQLESGLADAFTALSHTTSVNLERPAASQLLAQAFIDGAKKFYQVAARQGHLLAGFAGEKLVGHDDPKAPPTVNRYHHDPEMREIASKLTRGLSMSGFFALEGLVESSSGKIYLLEINRRLVGGAHRGGAFGVDLWAALHAAIDGGGPSPSRTDLEPGEEHIAVHFPQEWLRDPGSTWLRNYPVDVPWDEPALIDAMLVTRPS